MVCVRLFHSPVVSDATKVAKASLSVFLSRSSILPLSLSRGRTNLLPVAITRIPSCENTGEASNDLCKTCTAHDRLQLASGTVVLGLLSKLLLARHTPSMLLFNIRWANRPEYAGKKTLHLNHETDVLRNWGGMTDHAFMTTNAFAERKRFARRVSWCCSLATSKTQGATQSLLPTLGKGNARLL